MKLRKAVTTDGVLYGYNFWCEGCSEVHTIGTKWRFNGDMNSPTFSPSILVTKPSDPSYRCHSFIRSGRVEYQRDCSHYLAGDTIELGFPPDWLQ